MLNTHKKVCSPQTSYRREARGHGTKSFLDRLPKNRDERNRLAELLRRCYEYRLEQITFERYKAAALSIVRGLSRQLMKVLTNRFGRPDSPEFASAFAAA